MNKVLAIAPYSYLPYFSGGQKYIAQFLEWLGKEVDLTVVSVENNDFSLVKTYETLALLKKSFSRYLDRTLINKLVDIIRDKEIDTVICEHPYFAWLVFALRKRTGVKVIIHTHNIEYQRFRSTGRWWWPVLKGYEKRSFKKADALFFISSEDRDFAINKWGIFPNKCIELPYGVETHSNPDDKKIAREYIIQKHKLDPEDAILLFAGLLNYKPNLDGLKMILEKINPYLIQNSSFRYKVLVCGKGLPAGMEELKTYEGKNIVFAGFVEEINTYYKGADIFLNPVISGGGVKTKIIEAIAAGTTVVSTESGAVGVNRDACGSKLLTVADENAEDIARLIIEQAGISLETPGIFYQSYNWEKTIKNMLHSISGSAGQSVYSK